jgi:hypothetical protein
LPVHEIVVDVAGVQCERQRRRAARAGLVDRVGVAALVARRTVEELRDRRGDQLDVPDLLGPDPVEQVTEGLGRRAAEVEALEQVLHHRAHLAELATQPLLQGVGRGGIRLVGLDLVEHALHVEEHEYGLSWSCSNGRTDVRARRRDLSSGDR